MESKYDDVNYMENINYYIISIAKVSHPLLYELDSVPPAHPPPPHYTFFRFI